MKKRIISSLLSILLLFACFAPAVLAVEADAEPTYTVDKFHTDITELKAAVGEAGGVYFGDQDINRITNNIKSGLDANSAVAESVKDEEDYAYYNNIYTQYRARAAVYSTEHLMKQNLLSEQTTQTLQQKNITTLTTRQKQFSINSIPVSKLL